VEKLLFCYFYCNHYVNLIVLKPLLMDSLCSKVFRTYSFVKFESIDSGKIESKKASENYFENLQILNNSPFFLSTWAGHTAELGRPARLHVGGEQGEKTSRRPDSGPGSSGQHTEPVR
jgi:hypothetical protein